VAISDCISVRVWRDSLRLRYRSADLYRGIDLVVGSKQLTLAGLSPITITQEPPIQLPSDPAHSQILADAMADAVAEAHRSQQSRNARRPDPTQQVLYLEQIIKLCRDNGVVLTVATSPMFRTNVNGYPPGALETLTVELNRLAPIWDFASPPRLADNPSYWLDSLPFSKAVGSMMIDRMFAGNSHVPGRFRSTQATEFSPATDNYPCPQVLFALVEPRPLSF
jgi:hypothetical protein